MAIERVRTIVTATGERSVADDVIHLDKVDAAAVAVEGREAGFWPRAPCVIPPTDEHVGTTVVLLRG